MITIIASENVIADLINQEFEDMLNAWEYEQEHAQEIEDRKYLKHLEDEMKSFYEEGNEVRFNSLWDFYSDIYKDIYGVRPHWFLETRSWFHGWLS